MGFFLQLKLLVWKNFTLRKRHKVRCVVELVWPLFLFAILMWVRTRGLKEFIGECHFQQKALPSAGELPFLQSFFCGFNNTCHSTVNATRYGSSVYNVSSILSQLGNDMETLFGDATLIQKWKRIQNLNRDIEDLSGLVRNVTSRNDGLKGAVKVKSFLSAPDSLKQYLKQENITLDEKVVDILYNSEIAIQNISLAELLLLRKDPRALFCDQVFTKHFLVTERPEDLTLVTSALCNMSSSNLTNILLHIRKDVKLADVQDEMTKYVESNLGRSLDWDQWQQLNQLTRELAQELEALDAYQDVLKTAMAAGNNYRALMAELEKQNVSTGLANLILAQHFICGEGAGDFLTLIANGGGFAQSNQFDPIKEKLKELRDQAFHDYENDTEASPECNAAFKSLETNVATRFIWLQIKPFFRGKILFAPKNSPLVLRIMQRVNESFALISNLKELSKLWVNFTLPVARDQLVNDSANLQLIREFVASDLGRMSLQSSVDNRLVDSFVGNNATERVDYVMKMTDRLLSANNSEGRAEVFDTFQKIQLNISLLLDCFDVNKTEGYATEEEAAIRGMELIERNKFWALISFLDLEDETDGTQPFISYKIRMDSDRVDNTRFVTDRLWHAGPRRRPAVDLKYITYGFAYLQDLIEHSIIKEQTGRNYTPGMFLQQYPYPCHIVDRFVLAISRTFPLFMTLSWVYSCSMIIKSIVYEKERRLKETMRVMGLGNGVHWVGWFIDSIVPMIVTIILLTIILVYGRVLEKSDPSVVFVFLLLYCISTIAKSFLLSTFFSRANLAAAAGGIVFFILYLPYPFMVIWTSFGTNAKIVASLLSNVAFGFGCSYFAFYEEMGEGMQWRHIGVSPKLDDQYNLQYVMLMLVFDTFLYLLLTWYIETVFPGEYGVPKPWYFPLQKTYWCQRHSSTYQVADGIPYDHHASRSSLEAEPQHLVPGVCVRSLGKVYGNGKVALKDLNVNFYENQITSFLGHNGAGKTTTISILTGIFPPSSGTATIYNLDIRKDMDQIRTSLGVCPQHNVLFDRLSVEEHLWFYARLKGHPVNMVVQEIEQMLVDIGLPQKRKAQAWTLSGGMQRKLSIAAAFIGGSKTVILDEPTSGVDPFARRSIWELLIKYKQGRTVILTTHFMDEADLLGDRIAIIANGQLQCCGSSLFLKAKFGLGYYLTVETREVVDIKHSISKIPEAQTTKNGVASTNTSAVKPSNIDGITKLIRSHVSQAKLVQHLGTELVYNLPVREHKEVFDALFDALDSSMTALGILSYGISDTTLEEIFLKVAERGDVQTSTANGYENPAASLSIPSDEATPGKDEGICGLVRHSRPWSLFRRKCTDCNDDTDFGMKILDESISSRKQIVVQLQGANVTYSEVAGLEMDGNPDRKLKKPSHLKWEQFKALQVKRFNHTKRNPKAMFCELVVPALFVCTALAFTVILPKAMQNPPLVLEPSVYPPPNHVFFSDEDPRLLGNWTRRYEAQLMGPIGLGTQCVQINGSTGEYCHPVNVGSLAYTQNVSMTSPDCSCEMGTPVCEPGAGGPDPPKALGSSGDYLANMTGRNISDWIVKTTPSAYEQTKGYGGFSLGVSNPLGRLNVSRVLELLELVNQLTGIGNMLQLALSPDLLESLQRFTRNNDLSALENDRDVLDNIRVWFNNKGWVSSVAYMNAINNVVLRASLPPDKQSDQHLYGIQVINHPMNFTTVQANDELIERSGVSLLHAIAVIFALSFVPASFVVFLIEERVSNAKHQQFVSGANRLIYWLAALAWDMAAFSFSALLCVLMFLAFNEEAYVRGDHIAGLILLLLFYGWASVPLMYPASFLFSIPSSAFVALACANLFVGIVTTVATFVLGIFDDDELQYISSILEEVFLVFPQFCLGHGLMSMARNHLETTALSRFGVIVDSNIFSWDYLGKNIFCLVIEGIIFFSINLMIEFNVFRVFKAKRKLQLIPPTDEEDDVAAERRRILNGQAANEILVLKNLTKVYGRGPPAVDQICAGVKRGECFGLLGLNGAGKTSTFKMLTGDTQPSSGDAFITSLSIRHQMDAVRQRLGYCPQFDALNDLLTPREHLQLYCRLRGVPKAQRRQAVDQGLSQLGLGYYADRCAGTLSGGNKRKLSTAIALVGDPPLVFLDEPTSGMDPKARRFLWSCILKIVEQGRSVVLTSHSMEECQALCTKLTIMVNGKFKCFGSSQHLKNKYGSGYSLQVRCRPDCVDSVLALVKSRLPGATIREAHYNRLHFQLNLASVKLAVVFRVMELASRNQQIDDYSLSQTTLEEVFLRFAKEQTSDRGSIHEEVQSPEV